MPDEPTPPTTFDEALAKLTKSRAAFVNHYLGKPKDGETSLYNGTKSAKFAGFAEKSAYQEAYRLLRNAEVKLAIRLGMAERAMSAEEVVDRVSEMAAASMEDFITLEEVEYTEPIFVPAFERREVLRARIADAHDRLEADNLEQKAREQWFEIIDKTTDELEKLPDNPQELVRVDGPARRAMIARVDLVKAEKNGKLHLIRKIKQTDRGLEIELHDPQKALEMLGRKYRLFSDRVSLENPDGTPIKFMVGVNEEDL